MNCQEANQVQLHVDLEKALSKSGGKEKDRIVQEILSAIHALLNTSGGGTIELLFTNKGREAKNKFIQIIEQKLLSSIDTQKLTSHFTCESFREGAISCKVKENDTLITASYNLYVPSQTLANKIPSTEKIDTILKRQHVPQPVPIHSHHKEFTININCGFTENKNTEFKYLTARPSKCTTLADRMTSKGNKFSCYVSAFSNHNGGHIYYGITDNGLVKGEFIPNEKDKGEIIKKVEKVINKMIWPEQIGQPKQGKQWEIFFEPVVDKNLELVALTFVIVIYIAPCLGGVFTEEPECYEMMDGKVSKMSFSTWKKRILEPIWPRCKEEIPSVVPRLTWSTTEVKKAFTVASLHLGKVISDGNWNAIWKLSKRLQKESQLREVWLAVLSTKITARYAKGHFREADSLLFSYEIQLPHVKDILIFELIYLNLKAALKRASKDFEGLGELLTEALSKAEMIEPGLVTARTYAFAATVSDLVPLGSNKISPDVFAIKALQHSQHVEDCSSFHADMAQRVFITLASSCLRCNLNGQRRNLGGNIDTSDLDKAKTSIMTVCEFACENPLSLYREVQLDLVRSIYYYRRSQVSPGQRVRLLRSAFNYAKKAECLARDYQFVEMVEWSKANEALCTEELVLTKFRH